MFELYDFLKENETGLYFKENEVVAFVRVYFSDLGEFVEIIGDHFFDCATLLVNMTRDTICVDLNEIVELEGYKLSDFKKCFDESDWQYYEKYILESENVDNV